MNTSNENVFKALSDSQRRKILAMLRGGAMPAGDIAHKLDITPATASHHLGKLKEADLVRIRKEGQQRIYTLNLTVVEEALMMLTKLLGTDKDHKK